MESGPECENGNSEVLEGVQKEFAARQMTKCVCILLEVKACKAYGYSQKHVLPKFLRPRHPIDPLQYETFC